MTNGSHGKAAPSLRRGKRRPRLPVLLFAIAALGGAARLEAAIDVTFGVSPAGFAPVGRMVRWSGQVSGATGKLSYRFRVRERGGEFRMIRDFGPTNVLDWTSLTEGIFEIELTVRDRALRETVTEISAYRFLTRITSAAPVVTATSQPLVFLFSSAGCDGDRARVWFASEGGPEQYTPFKPCVSGRSVNFYLAGLVPNTSYSARLVVEQMRDATAGPAVPFATGEAPFEISPEVLQFAAAPAAEGILLQAPLFLPPFATDLNGNLVWIGPRNLTYMTRPEAGGTFFGIAESRTEPAQNLVRQFDLVGMTVRETNAERVSEQLVAMGRRPITGFHHEARSIRDGKIAALASVEQIFTDVQGPGPVNVLGDMIVVFDAELQVLWSWDAFDHLDVARKALLGETCLNAPACAPYFLTADANDWTHSNSLAETPDGALIISVRHQDWVVKVDYARGEGGGEVIWRLGKDGDFTLDSDDPYPWFSHQHDASYEPRSRSTISIFDNGNTRAVRGFGASSRGQVLELDEPNRIARLVLNADLGLFSFALGSAQQLAGGNYHFDAGFEAAPGSVYGGVGYAMEVAPPGDVVSSLKMAVPVYRSFRVMNLYGPAAEDRPATRVVGFRD
jgi:hypothetical protein